MIHRVTSVAVMCGTLISTVEPNAGTEPVSVVVTVRAEGGSAIEGVPFVLYSSAGSWCGMTGADGSAVIGAQIDRESDRDVSVWIVPGTEKCGNDEAVELRRAKWKSFVDAHCVRHSYKAAMVAGQSVYALEIVASPPRRVSGRVVSADGVPRTALVQWDGMLGKAMTKPTTGAWNVAMPKNRVTEIFITCGSWTQTLVVSAGDEDVNIGDVVCEPPVGTRSIVVTRANPVATQNPIGGSPNDGMTFVGIDGVNVFSFGVAEVGNAFVSPSGGAMMLPPGTYYAVPGLFGIASPAAKILAVVRSGHPEMLEKIPSVNTAQEAIQPLQLDIRGLTAAIGRLP